MRRWCCRIVLLALALALAACGERALPGPGGDGAGGGRGPDGAICDADDDAHGSIPCGGGDCDDTDPARHPGAPERCDGRVDEDCDGTVDEGCACVTGDRRRCFPPGEDAPARNVGACRDGVQVCEDGSWSRCEGAIVPTADGPACDALDQDCDGVVDGGVTNACGGCGARPVEQCGNGLDDDCDGLVDPGALCSVHCEGVDPERPTPPSLACCVRDPDGVGLVARPVLWSTLCVEHPGLPPCAARACVDLDGDPGTSCVRHAVGVELRCGLVVEGAPPVASDGCGFATPCAWRDCGDREQQPCYSGPPATLGVGACHGGRADCSLDPTTGVRDWTSCVGEVRPATERCGDGVDDDCDGLVDEVDGVTGQRCSDLGRCAPGATERCGTGLDEDCDGFVDEGCAADAPSQPCYGGPLGTRGIGACRDGVQPNTGGVWGACVDEQRPTPERCGDGLDSDCDGRGGTDAGEDDACCVAAGEEVCNGIDDDCDGLADEGVSSACGRCGEACFAERFRAPAPCLPGQGRTCDRVKPDANDPDAFTIDADKHDCTSTTAIFLSLDGLGQVAKLDTRTGQKIWQVDSRGGSPSRTAMGCDGGVWVGNRGFEHTDDPRFSNAVHLDVDGAVVCVAPIPGLVRGVAIDVSGDVWIGTYETNRVYKVSGTQLDGTFEGLPACRIFDLAPNDPAELGLHVGVPVYGLAIDDRGILWTDSRPTARVDTNTLAVEIVAHSDRYGIAIDADRNVWFGGADVGLHRVSATGPYVDPALYELRSPALGITPAVGRDGVVWGSDQGGEALVRLDPVTMQAQRFPLPAGFGNSPKGVAEDGAGKIWIIAQSGGWAFRFDPVTQHFDPFEVDAGQHLYTYSDMTGTQLRSFMGRQGRWSQTWDGGAADVQWRSLSWSERVPPGAEVQLWARFADTELGLHGTARVCGPYAGGALDLTTCPGATSGRYLAIEFVLRPNDAGEAPVVGDVTLRWTRP